MNYLIFYNGEAFYTSWFDQKNNYMDGMVVFNLLTDSFTTDGIIWEQIKQDHL
jgi:hypothetical protein